MTNKKNINGKVICHHKLAKAELVTLKNTSFHREAKMDLRRYENGCTHIHINVSHTNQAGAKKRSARIFDLKLTKEETWAFAYAMKGIG
jgi:hypothetical protein